MTTRLYYTDSELTEFEAVVRSCEPAEGDAGFDVVLDRTAFYPTSGGQPFDTGWLGDARVTDVVDRDDDEIVHRVTAPIAPGAPVRGAIDEPRRRDHRQQHTGQHILSAAFDRRLGVRTESFHMGAAVSTIDLAREVSADEIAAAETEANRVVWDDRPVTVRFVSDEEARALPLRKPPARSGSLRLVEVADFDLSACGGTHVARTGAIGIIAVAAWERVKGATRVTFVCGGRALQSHRALRDAVQTSARALGVPSAALAEHVLRLQREARDGVRALEALEIALARYRGAELRAMTEPMGRVAVVVAADPSWRPSVLKIVAQSVVSGSGLVAALVGGGEPAAVVVARSADVDLDASAIVRETVAALGGRGGGRPDLAQGGVQRTPVEIVTFLRKTIAGRTG